jgi:hypothetical protein
MGLFTALWMVVLGVLGAANLIISKKPEAKELIGKLAPYQGWIGAASALWGLWGVILMIMRLGWLGLGFGWLLYWITYLVTSLVMLALGLLFGVGVLKTFIKQPQAVEKMDETVAKLAPYQGKLGLLSIALGIWMLVAGLLFI